ncbi:hypothetical protein Ddc_19849 [Ditylenchus destructor]|nr:hypothetical protein Ddc_19849 [Ditylenchus destructor]
MFVNLSPETSLEVLKHLTRFKLENLRLTNLEFNNFIVSQKRYLPVHNLSVNVEWHSMKPLDVRVNIQLKGYEKYLPDWRWKKILFTRYAGGYVDSMLGIQLRDLDEMIRYLILHMRNSQIFHQSCPEDITWPSYIMVAPFANCLQVLHKPVVLRKRNSGDDLCDTYYQKMESDQTLEYIWPNIRDFHCHRISKHLLEIPHKNGSRDGRILQIRFEKRSTNGSTCNLIFETIDSRNQES